MISLTMQLVTMMLLATETNSAPAQTPTAACPTSCGNLTSPCQEAQKNLSSFACQATHSECIDSGNGPDYDCKCSRGFQGNPYLVDGCQDIDECIVLEPCVGTCTNFQGSYACSCPEGFEGDGNKDGFGCQLTREAPNVQEKSCRLRFCFCRPILYLLASGIASAVFVSVWIFWRRKQKKVMIREVMKQKKVMNLEVTLSIQIRRLVLSTGGKLSIFTAEDLKKATNNYDEDNFLSLLQHFGNSYRGVLPHGQIVTIMKCNALDACHIEGFTSMLITVSQIQHENTVRLLGCCLETHVTLLVYEYFELQSLHYYIHNDHLACYLSWDIRLRVAVEIAQVLLHMQSYLDVQMINGWLSSSSILLDHGYNVKVHYYAPSFPYGSSVHFHEHTPGYLDPQYLLTSRFNVKSNVYSLGVILAEILTGKYVISSDGPEGEEDLAQYLLNSGNNLHMILDHRVKTYGHIHQLTDVVKVVQRCLSTAAEDRPAMEEVVIALEKARRMQF